MIEIDKLYDELYDMIVSRDYVTCNNYIEKFIEDKVSTKLIVALLTITKPLSSKLTNRTKLITKLEIQMTSDGRKQIEIDNILNTLRYD